MKSKKEQILEIVISICDLKGKSLSPGAQELYVDAIAEYSLDEIKRAAAIIVRSHKYASIPSPAEFIEVLDPPELKELAAAEAFKELEDTMTIAGPYRSVVFPDPILSAVIMNMGGWIKVCSDTRDMDQLNYKFFRKDFEKLYKAYSHKKNLKPMLLTGSHDAENFAAGYLDKGRNLLLSDGTRKHQLPYCPDGDLTLTGATYRLPDGSQLDYTQIEYKDKGLEQVDFKAVGNENSDDK